MTRSSTSSAAAPVSNPQMLAEVAEGLAAPQKELAPKYFYDHRGSELFEEITRLPEYYPTRTELSILRAHAPHIATAIGPAATLVEFGSGAAVKVKLLLDALQLCFQLLEFVAKVGYLSHDGRHVFTLGLGLAYLLGSRIALGLQLLRARLYGFTLRFQLLEPGSLQRVAACRQACGCSSQVIA